MGVKTVRVLGFLSNSSFRFFAYTFLRWLPGRQGPWAIPIVYVFSMLTHFFNSTRIPSPLSTSTTTKLIKSEPSTPPATITSSPTSSSPSYAAIASHEPSSDLPQDESKHLVHPLAVNGGTPGRRNKKRKPSSLRSVTSSEDLLAPSPELTSSEFKPDAKQGGFSISALLFGTPTNSPVINAISILFNTALFCAVLDSLWSPILFMEEQDLSFVRVGAVDHHSVKILARIPPPPLPSMSADSNATAATTTLENELWEEMKSAKVAYRPTRPLGKWNYGEEFKVKEEDDWIGLVKLDGLWASTEYEYRLLLPHSSTHHPSFPSINSFTTFPDPSLSSTTGSHFTFAATSCIKPGFPYAGPSSKRTVQGAKHLGTKIDELGIKFALFLGDFIYADVPFWPGPKLASYFKRYRQVLSSPEFKAVVEKIPTLTIWDDHEIRNDFSSSTSDPSYAPANHAFGSYIGQANPDPVEAGTNYFEFSHGADTAFFVWDTRSYRSENGATDDEEKSMLGRRQKEVFLQWLERVNQTVTFKFVVSSVPFMSLWSLSDDIWSGFLTERDELMDVMEYVPNLIILSGDRHEFAAASIRNTVTEFSTSPLNQFYLPIRTLSQSHGRGTTGEDVLLKYLPDGNSKFTTFEVDTRVANKPTVTATVFIDGEQSWQVTILGKPIKGVDLGAMKGIGSLGKSLMELLGFMKRSWF